MLRMLRRSRVERKGSSIQRRWESGELRCPIGGPIDPILVRCLLLLPAGTAAASIQASSAMCTRASRRRAVSVRGRTVGRRRERERERERRLSSYYYSLMQSKRDTEKRSSTALQSNTVKSEDKFNPTTV